MISCIICAYYCLSKPVMELVKPAKRVCINVEALSDWSKTNCHSRGGILVSEFTTSALSLNCVVLTFKAQY